MNKLKELYSKYWQYKGRKLANPLIILLRLFVLPVAYTLHAINTFLILISQGRYAAEQYWKDLC